MFEFKKLSNKKVGEIKKEFELNFFEKEINKKEFDEIRKNNNLKYRDSLLKLYVDLAYIYGNRESIVKCILDLVYRNKEIEKALYFYNALCQDELTKDELIDTAINC